DAKAVQDSIARGQRLFTSIGCIACHTSPEVSKGQASEGRQPPVASENRGLTSPARQWNITGMGSKTTPEKLAAYLQNPLAVDPSGRMPHLLLQPKEADDLARYLCQFTAKDIAAGLPPAPAKADVLAAFQRVEPRAEEQAAFQKLPADAQLLDL